MARLYEPSGHCWREIRPANGVAFTLAELRSLIGPALTVMQADTGRYLVFNERGPALQLPVNHAATRLLGLALGANGFIAGAALLCDRLEVGE